MVLDRFAVMYSAEMATRPKLPAASAEFEVPELPFCWQPVSRAILADGRLAILGADVDLAGEHRRIHAALLTSSVVTLKPPSQLHQLAARGACRIWTLGPEGWIEGPTIPLETPFPLMDRFADGRWLVVGARTSAGANARVIAPDGGLLDRFMLGDGIEHVVVDLSNRIWVGWFDEGVFGNDDWRVPDHDRAPSSNVVACFADDGALLDLPSWPDEIDDVSDCYALNAIGEGAWNYSYSNFPLVYFAPGKPARWWRNRLDGAQAIAIDGSHALLAGGYGSEATRLALVSLEGGGFGEDAQEVSSWSLPLRPRAGAYEPDGVWEPPSLLMGRGDSIHLIDGDVWRVWRVADLALRAESA